VTASELAARLPLPYNLIALWLEHVDELESILRLGVNDGWLLDKLEDRRRIVRDASGHVAGVIPEDLWVRTMDYIAKRQKKDEANNMPRLFYWALFTTKIRPVSAVDYVLAVAEVFATMCASAER
jgi:hypothetical protein